MTLRVLWESAPLCVSIVGYGGVGKMAVEFSDEKDLLFQGFLFLTIV